MSVPANAISKALHWWWRGATGVAVVAAIASARLAIYCKTWIPGKYVVAFGWALVPPAWFIFERQVLSGNTENPLDIATTRTSRSSSGQELRPC
jgi:hypothetical protein